MHPALSTNYVVPGLLLNPVLLLWSINTILSRLLPPLLVNAAIQPPPYYPLGPSAEHPHIDIHASESFCWSYTVIIVCANLVAFGRVSGRREEGKKQMRLKKERAKKMKREEKLMSGNSKHVIGFAEYANWAVGHENRACNGAKLEHAQGHSGESDLDESSPEWSAFSPIHLKQSCEHPRAWLT